MAETQAVTYTKKRRWFNLTDAEAARFNYPLPREIVEVEGEPGWWEPYIDDDEWLGLGPAPVPQTRLGWFCHHVMHGLLMRYPWHKVLGWSFYYSFIEPLHEGDTSE